MREIDRRKALGCLGLAVGVGAIGVVGAQRIQGILEEENSSGLPVFPKEEPEGKQALPFNFDPDKLKPGQDGLLHIAEILGPLISDPQISTLFYDAINGTVMQMSAQEKELAQKELILQEIKKLLNRTIPQILEILERELSKSAENNSLLEHAISYIKALRILINPTDEEKQVITDAFLVALPGGKKLDALLEKWSNIGDKDKKDVINLLESLLTKAPLASNALSAMIVYLKSLDAIGNAWQENKTNFITGAIQLVIEGLLRFAGRTSTSEILKSLDLLEKLLREVLPSQMTSQEVQNLIQDLGNLKQLVEN